MQKREFVELLAIPDKYCGICYLLDCVQIVMRDEEMLNPMNRKVYRIVAKRYETSIDCIRRDIKTVIDVWWKQGNRSILEQLRPDAKVALKNKEFINLLAAYLTRSAAKACVG